MSINYKGYKCRHDYKVGFKFALNNNEAFFFFLWKGDRGERQHLSALNHESFPFSALGFFSRA